MSLCPHICVLVTGCSLCILASCAFLPAGNIPCPQNSHLAKLTMAYLKFHCFLETSLGLIVPPLCSNSAFHVQSCFLMHLAFLVSFIHGCLAMRLFLP